MVAQTQDLLNKNAMIGVTVVLVQQRGQRFQDPELNEPS
jgi:hypothetical protein